MTPFRISKFEFRRRVYTDLFEGKILDGWNHYRASLETGTDPHFRPKTRGYLP